MLRRLIFPLVLGLSGCAVLLALGVWQLQRLAWKEGVLSLIEARIAAAPVAVPEAPDPDGDRYLAVRATGTLGGNDILVFAAVEGLGIGYRVIAAFYSGDRSFLVDLGFVPQEAGDVIAPGRMAEGVTITGNLAWPDDVTASTPPPDAATGMFYGRDVAALAQRLGTEPVLIVARTIEGTDTGTRPVPVTTMGIPNDHLNYAITWFLLAAVWAAMSVWLAWRSGARKD